MSETVRHVPDGFQVYGQSTTGYMDANDVIHLDSEAYCIMLYLDPDTATSEEITEKLSIISASKAGTPGTIAFMPGWNDAWQLKANGDWYHFISST